MCPWHIGSSSLAVRQRHPCKNSTNLSPCDPLNIYHIAKPGLPAQLCHHNVPHAVPPETQIIHTKLVVMIILRWTGLLHRKTGLAGRHTCTYNGMCFWEVKSQKHACFLPIKTYVESRYVSEIWSSYSIYIKSCPYIVYANQ